MIMGNVSERRKQPPQVGVSVVILALGPASHGTQEHARTSAGSTLWIPLVRRVRQPFLGQWALPGGGLRADHSLEQSAYVALESTTSLHPRYLEQLYTFSDPARSHGGLPMVSIVYWALVDDLNGQLGQSIDDNVKWFPVDDLPELAFDHGDIVDYALSRLRGKIEYPQIVTRLVGERFTLSQLHDVYEAVAGQSIDLANFRRKMLASGQLEDTGDKLRVGRNRPATVYRYTMDVLRQSTWSDARDRHDFDVRETQDDVLSALTTI